jgi:GTPase SAR1 family protein
MSTTANITQQRVGRSAYIPPHQRGPVVSKMAADRGSQATPQTSITDLVSSLEACGINADFPTLKLVVCGDRGSGKSAVLEAIGGVAFRIDDIIGTRLPVEVTMRKSDVVGLRFSIRPSPTRSDFHAESLRLFSPSFPSCCKLSTLSDIIEAATDRIAKVCGMRTLYDDTLVVRMSGPGLKNMTIIDLPGQCTDCA